MLRHISSQEVLLRIDRETENITRSKFLVKLIELAYNTNRIKPQGAIYIIIKENDVLSDVCPP